MKDEDRYRHLHPLVKQDLNMLDADGDTRRLAVKSLKLMVKQLDASTLPRFVSQISESHEPGATRSYVIYVYEEIGRVHGKLIVPHIPKIMGFIVRSSSAIGSCHVLQEACAKVTASLANCGIDSSTSQEDAEEIMREICMPLIDALAGKLDAVAATAASCIHAVVETDKWKYAREEMVHKVCHRTFVALGEKPTRTAAHLQLICALTLVNPDIISSHAGSLLRAAEEILKVTANPWQLRKASAQLLLSVLTILDKDKLQRELNSAINVLDGCRLDKMQQVRTAVSDALHAARILASGRNVFHPSLHMAASPIHKQKDRSDLSPRSVEENPISPLYKQGSGSRSSTPPGELELSSPVSRPVDTAQVLTDLKDMSLSNGEIAIPTSGPEISLSQESFNVPCSPTSTSQESLNVPCSPTSTSQESLNVPCPPTSTSQESLNVPCSPTSTSQESLNVPCSPTSTSQESLHVPHSPTSTSLETVEVSSPALSEGASNHPGSPQYPPPDMTDVLSSESVITPGTSPSNSITAEEECESPSRNLYAEFRGGSQSNGESCSPVKADDAGRDDHVIQSEVPLTSDGSFSLPPTDQDMLSVEVQNTKESQELETVDTAIFKHPEHLHKASNEKSDSKSFIHSLLNAIDGSTPIPGDSSMNMHLVVPSNVDERSTKGEGNDTSSDSTEEEKREIIHLNPPICIQDTTVAEVEGDVGNTKGEVCASHEQLELLENHDIALDHVGVDAENEKTESLNEVEDLLPFVTPTELLQSPSGLSLPDSRESVPKDDTNLLQNEPLLSTEPPTSDVDSLELKGETSNEASGSVHDNPIASEGSFRIEKSSEEIDAHRKGDTSPKVHKVDSLDIRSREIHIISETHLSSDNITSVITSNPVKNSVNDCDRACCPKTDDAGHPLGQSSVLVEQIPTTSKPRTSPQVIKGMHRAPNGLSSLLHEDEMTQVHEPNSNGHVNDPFLSKKSECTPSSKKHSRKHEKEGKGLRIRIKVIARGWRKVRSCAEAALRGSLCVAIVVPLAVIVAKAFNGSRDSRLVPT